tara:strand:+ start:1428 stop:1772 length:345 start_codon:yes stop_codon:yes gene_type:complete
MNHEYAKQLGYKKPLDLIMDHYDPSDFGLLIEDIINGLEASEYEHPANVDALRTFVYEKFIEIFDEFENEISATHVMDDLVNEHVNDLVEEHPKLRPNVKSLQDRYPEDFRDDC